MLKPVSEEQRLRAELERARRALAHMQEVARLGTWERDETTGIAEWSQGLENLLGFGQRTHRALETWLDLVHPDDRPRVAETIHAGVQRGHGYQYECRIRVGGEDRLMH